MLISIIFLVFASVIAMLAVILCIFISRVWLFFLQIYFYFYTLFNVSTVIFCKAAKLQEIKLSMCEIKALLSCCFAFHFIRRCAEQSTDDIRVPRERVKIIALSRYNYITRRLICASSRTSALVKLTRYQTTRSFQNKSPVPTEPVCQLWDWSLIIRPSGFTSKGVRVFKMESVKGRKVWKYLSFSH